MVWIVGALAAGPGPVSLMIEGEVLSVYHGDYCSFPRVPGVTTKVGATTPPNVPWDHVFDVKNGKQGFTGLVMGDPPVAATPLVVHGDLLLPEAPLVRAALKVCAPHTLDRPGLEELLRKSSAAARSLLIRHLINQRILERPCALQERAALMKAAFVCDGGKCGDFLERVDAAGARCK